MKYKVFTSDGYGLPVAWHLQREGKDIEAGLVKDLATVTHDCEHAEPENARQRARGLSLFDRMLNKRPAATVLKDSATVRRGRASPSSI